MKDRLEQIKAQALEQIKASDMPEKLNEVRVKFLGKKGELTAVLKGMKDVAPEERPKVGQLVNETRAAIEELLEETKVKMEAAIREEKMKAEVIDVTLPSKKSTVGHRHPNTIAGRGRAHFRGNGIRSSRRTGSRIRPVQLRETQHSGWASCKR